MHYLPVPPPRVVVALTLVVAGTEALADYLLTRAAESLAGRAPEFAEDPFDPRAVCAEETS